LAFSLMQVLVVCLVGFYATTQSANTEIQTQRKLARNLMALAEPSVLNMLAVRDTRGLKAYLENLIQNTAIAGVFVSNPTGTVIYGL
ncbi:MAG: hypothetical protein GWN58_17685, partial [Anaerolineae bacterium]|nr:hypothetical protein [Anaerolineae bacterium]